jgi:hypothetical protein
LAISQNYQDSNDMSCYIPRLLARCESIDAHNTMPKPKWTTKEQHDWLTSHLPAFTTEQEKKPQSMSKFFSALYVQWFKDFPNPEPTAAQLAAANGDRAIADAKLTKTAKDVSTGLHVKSHRSHLEADLISTSTIGFSTILARLARVLVVRRYYGSQ